MHAHATVNNNQHLTHTLKIKRCTPYISTVTSQCYITKQELISSKSNNHNSFHFCMLCISLVDNHAYYNLYITKHSLTTHITVHNHITSYSISFKLFYVKKFFCFSVLHKCNANTGHTETIFRILTPK